MQASEARVTAPRFGYPSCGLFCEMNRPAAVLPHIRVPTLLVMATDDPLAPPTAVRHGLVAGSGHCGPYDRAPGALFEGAARPAHQNPGRGVSSIITWSSPPSTRISAPFT